MRVVVALAQYGKMIIVIAVLIDIDTGIERDMLRIVAHLCQPLDGYIVLILVVALHAEVVGMVGTEIERIVHLRSLAVVVGVISMQHYVGGIVRVGKIRLVVLTLVHSLVRVVHSGGIAGLVGCHAIGPRRLLKPLLDILEHIERERNLAVAVINLLLQRRRDSLLLFSEVTGSTVAVESLRVAESHLLRQIDGFPRHHSQPRQSVVTMVGINAYIDIDPRHQGKHVDFGMVDIRTDKVYARLLAHHRKTTHSIDFRNADRNLVTAIDYALHIVKSIDFRRPLQTVAGIYHLAEIL